MSPAEQLWRILPAVRRRERARFVFFLSLSGLIQLALTMGIAGSEALFLARVGVEWLPHTFVLASAVAVAGSLLYAAGVDRARNDDYFISMLLGSAFLLIVATVQAQNDAGWIYPALFSFYYLNFAVFTNHFWTFATDYFDTLSAKRLFPLFTVGASLGGFAGGLLTAVVSRVFPAEILVAGWGVLLTAAALMLRLGRRRLRCWGPLELEEADETSVEGMRGAIRYMRRSALGRWLMLSAVSMILALFISQYLYSDIFLHSFPDEERLAAFLGVYLAVTNLIEVAVEVWLTPWVIQRFGVAGANLIHPTMTLGCFALLSLDYRLLPALLTRANRELMENSMAGPIRNLIYNALPARFRGRMRAFLEGVVVYSGMCLAGITLTALKDTLDPWLLCLVGAGTALLYLLANLRVRQEYLRTIVAELRAGRLDLAELHGEMGNWEVSRLAELWGQLLPTEGQNPTPATLQLAPALALRGIVDPLVTACRHPHPRVRKACLEALALAPREPPAAPVLASLDDPDPEVRRAALKCLDRYATPLAGQAEALRRRLADGEPRVRAEAARRLGKEGQPELVQMARGEDPEVVQAALRALPEPLLEEALKRVEDGNPAIQAAALECVARLARPVPLSSSRLARPLRHPDSRVRRAAVAALATRPDPEAPVLLASALEDPSHDVRSRTCAALGQMGEAGMEAAAAYLHADATRTVEAAVEALAAHGSERARRILAEQLHFRVVEAWRCLLALHTLPDGEEPPRRFLRIALEDAAARNRRLAFRILERTEDAAVIRTVEKTLRFESARHRADALEVLSNLGDRETAQLLVLMLEEGPLDDKISALSAHLKPPDGTAQVLEQARQAADPFLRLGAAGCDGVPGERIPREKRMERLLVLRQVPLFAHMNLEQLEAIDRIVREAEYLAGEVIIREGDVGSELFLMIEGEVAIYKNYATSEQFELATLSGINYFGEMAILDDDTRSASVVARRDTRVLVLEGERLKELILQMPEIAFEIFRVLTRRIRSADRRLEQMARAARGEERSSRSPEAAASPEG